MQNNYEKFQENLRILELLKSNFQTNSDSTKFDIQNCKLTSRTYGGCNGQKIGVEYNGIKYLIKFPLRLDDQARQDFSTTLEYGLDSVVEDISCRIFNLLGVEAQKTILGKYEDQICVVCRDFVEEDFRFQDFSSLKNTDIITKTIGKNTELSEVLRMFDIQGSLNLSSDILKDYFWDMFIIDTLLANFDRHNENWGFLINEKKNIHKFSPIFDCGSCLFPKIDEKTMQQELKSKGLLDRRVYKMPTSAYRENGNRFKPHTFLNRTSNLDCLRSLKKILNRIELSKIFEIVENTPYVSDLHKEWLKKLIATRKECILDAAYKQNPYLATNVSIENSIEATNQKKRSHSR